MARRSSSRREFSIPGDELEQHRIRLEQNLQNTDLSLHLSSAGDNESVEYPRHDSAPEHPPLFASFDRHSQENLDLDDSHVRAWSIHDGEGINPYDVRTMSTAAHHASAVTITAGLGRGGKREPSISGAEYDPERPLQDIMTAGSDGRPRGGQSRTSQPGKYRSARSNRSRVHLPDVTGLTSAVISPAKANLERHGVRGSNSREVEARLVASLNALHTRLNHLETENSIARRRVRELECELEECKRDVVRERTQIMVQEKKALESLITTLRSHLARVTSDLSSQQQLLEELRTLRESDALSLTEKAREIIQLRAEVERLAGEIEVLRGVVEEGLSERRHTRDGSFIEKKEHHVDRPTVKRFIDDEEIDRISVDLDERRSERASNSSVQSSPNISSRAEIRLEDKNDEQLPLHDQPRKIGRDVRRKYTIEDILERMDRNGGTLGPGDVPPQTVLARVISELEDEFAHFREIYSGLAEEYKSLDCATEATKRHVVGDRLRDVIEVLECKGAQIASLYDLLTFKDKPVE